MTRLEFTSNWSASDQPAEEAATELKAIPGLCKIGFDNKEKPCRRLFLVVCF